MNVRRMRRLYIALAIFAGCLSLAALGVGLDTRQWMGERLLRLEQTVFEQQTQVTALARQREEDNRTLRLLHRAQESPWVGAEDAPLQARMTAEADLVRVGQPIRLLAEVRNVSDRQQRVTGLFVQPFTVGLFLNGTRAQYVGPMKEMMAPGPVVLPPGRIMREFVTLSPSDFAELRQPGRFTAHWQYSSSDAGGPVTWEGTLPVTATWQTK